MSIILKSWDRLSLVFSILKSIYKDPSRRTNFFQCLVRVFIYRFEKVVGKRKKLSEKNGLRYWNYYDSPQYSDLIYYDRSDDYYLRVMEKYFTSSSVIFDIGANVGKMRLNLGFDLKCKEYIAFEPSPDSYERLQEIKDLNKGVKLTTECIALSNYIGKARFLNNFVGTENRILKNGDENCIEVVVETIESYAKRKSLIPNIIKIDVEGEEWNVISGAEKFFKSGDISCVVFENNLKASEMSLLRKLLNANSYSLFMVGPDNYLHDITNSGGADKDDVKDYIILKKIDNIKTLSTFSK